MDNAEFQKIIGGRIENPSQNLKCFDRCVMESTGFMSHGKIDEETSLKRFEERHKRTVAAFSTCKSEIGTDTCDTAYKFTECMHDNFECIFVVINLWSN